LAAAMSPEAIGIVLESTQDRSWDLCMPQWPSLSIKEAAERTGYNEEYIRRLIRQDKLDAVKVGPSYLIRADSLERYLAETKTSADSRAGPRGLRRSK
jgi:excisionase family DNA binding protein